jgi:hypothetical protein
VAGPRTTTPAIMVVVVDHSQCVECGSVMVWWCGGVVLQTSTVNTMTMMVFGPIDFDMSGYTNRPSICVAAAVAVRAMPSVASCEPEI